MHYIVYDEWQYKSYVFKKLNDIKKWEKINKINKEYERQYLSIEKIFDDKQIKYKKLSRRYINWNKPFNQWLKYNEEK